MLRQIGRVFTQPLGKTDIVARLTVGRIISMHSAHMLSEVASSTVFHCSRVLSNWFEVSVLRCTKFLYLPDEAENPERVGDSGGSIAGVCRTIAVKGEISFTGDLIDRSCFQDAFRADRQARNKSLPVRSGPLSIDQYVGHDGEVAHELGTQRVGQADLVHCLPHA